MTFQGPTLFTSGEIPDNQGVIVTTTYCITVVVEDGAAVDRFRMACQDRLYLPGGRVPES